MIRVLIVHENPLFRTGLCSVLEQHEEIQVVGVVGEIAELEQLLELRVVTQPDVVLFDGACISCQPAWCAVEVVAHLHRAGARGMLVFAPSAEEEDLFRFLMSGAAAYELPTLSEADLVEKIRRLANGEYLINGEVLPPLPSKRPLPVVSYIQAKPLKVLSSDSAAALSQRGMLPCPALLISSGEIEILKEIMNGLTNGQVARILGLSRYDVKQSILVMMKKFAVDNRTLLVMRALCSQLLSLDDVRPSSHPMHHPITVEETKILKEIMNGLTNDQIGQAVGLSRYDVKKSIALLMRKFAANDRTLLVVRALCSQFLSLDDVRPSDHRIHHPITVEEIEILKEIMNGLTNDQIGQRMGMRADYVKRRITPLMEKLVVNDRTSLVMKALRSGLVSFDDLRPNDLIFDQEEEATQSTCSASPDSVGLCNQLLDKETYVEAEAVLASSV